MPPRPRPQKKKSQCEGCRENQPNQAAHMAPGGCLSDDVNNDKR